VAAMVVTGGMGEMGNRATLTPLLAGRAAPHCEGEAEAVDGDRSYESINYLFNSFCTIFPAILGYNL
jgi:hypothetical protein